MQEHGECGVLLMRVNKILTIFTGFFLMLSFSLSAWATTWTFDNVVVLDTATSNIWTSSASDGDHHINVSNTNDYGTPIDGDCSYNKTTNMFRCYNGGSWTDVFTSGATSSLNLATTGTITGAIMILNDEANPTAPQCYGSWNETSGAGTHTVPPAQTGMSICFGTSTAAIISIDPDPADHFVLDGVAYDAGHGVTNSSGGADDGDYICMIALNTSTWKIVGKQGTWESYSP
jgi:hypothetical protein